MSTPHDPLDSMLESLRSATPAQPETVRHEVWRRIAHAEQAAAGSLPWWHRLESAFARPAFAATFVAACLLLGLFLAEIRLTRLQAERTAALEASYLRLIDPLFDASNLAPVRQATPTRP